MDIFKQLGDLFLSAVPTVIFVFFFYLFLRWSFFTPIEKVLAERHRRAEGARQDAESSRAAAQEKLRAYNDALRAARGKIFAEQEQQRHRFVEERQAAVQAARLAAQKELQEAKKALAADVEAARTQLEQSTDALADQIAAAIVAGNPDVSPAPAAGGVR